MQIMIITLFFLNMHASNFLFSSWVLEHSIPLLSISSASPFSFCMLFSFTWLTKNVCFINYFKALDLFTSSHIRSACLIRILRLVFLLLSCGFPCLWWLWRLPTSALILMCIFCSWLLLLAVWVFSIFLLQLSISCFHYFFSFTLFVQYTRWWDFFQVLCWPHHTGSGMSRAGEQFSICS